MAMTILLAQLQIISRKNMQQSTNAKWCITEMRMPALGGKSGGAPKRYWGWVQVPYFLGTNFQTSCQKKGLVMFPLTKCALTTQINRTSNVLEMQTRSPLLWTVFCSVANLEKSRIFKCDNLALSVQGIVVTYGILFRLFIDLVVQKDMHNISKLQNARLHLKHAQKSQKLV